jgi:lysophospholipase L1-like esterase
MNMKRALFCAVCLVTGHVFGGTWHFPGPVEIGTWTSGTAAPGVVISSTNVWTAIISGSAAAKTAQSTAEGAMSDAGAAASAAGAAYSLAQSAKGIAESGTLNAAAAMSVAQTGTANAAAAMTVAQTGTTNAAAAMTVAQSGTTNAAAAMTVAQTGTTNAAAAMSVAQTGTTNAAALKIGKEDAAMPYPSRLVAHWSAIDAGSIGQSPSTWMDRVAGYTLTKGGTGATLVASRSGWTAMRFTGSAGYYVLPANSLPTSLNSAFTLVLVADINVQGSYKMAVAFGDGTANEAWLALTNGGSWFCLNSQATNLGASAAVYQKPHVFVAATDGTAAAVRIDGIEGPTTGSSTAATVSSLPLYVGAWGTGSASFNGDISEIMIFSGKLTDAECLVLERSLFNRYCLLLPESSVNLVIQGDSLSVANQGTNPTATWWMSLEAAYPYTRFQILAGGGRNFSGFLSGVLTSEQRAYDGKRSRNILVVGSGNSIAPNYGNQTASVAWATAKSYLSAVRLMGYKVVLWDCLPRTTAGFAERRAEFNALAEVEWPLVADAFVKTSLNSTIGDDDDAANATYYSDGIHLTATGASVLSGMISPAISALMAREVVRITGTDTTTPNTVVTSGTNLLFIDSATNSHILQFAP